ncbi:MAG: ERAP1-like C-terminal domain-containing protein [Myxococcales bacterium]|nr:ERAP1-like C-terminal domain-containing protein [Myxococcales bacterium]
MRALGSLSWLSWLISLSWLVAACSSHEAAHTPPPRQMPVVAVRDAAIDAAMVPDPTLRLPDGVAPLGYALRLELDPAQPGFRGEVDIRIRVAAPTRKLWLHAGDLTITAATFREHDRDGAIVAGDKHPHELLPLELDRVVGPGELEVHLAYTGNAVRDQEGLFRQRQGGQWFLFSQAEAAFARQIVPCFDEPRFKVPWRVTLTVPGDQIALGNAPVAQDTKLPDGRHEVRFDEIAALPSYLLAVAVGPFEIVDGGTVGRAKIPFRVAVARGARTRAAFAVTTTAKLVAALEDYFDQPIPLAKLDFVAVPELFGAMEHPGLVTFESTILLGEGDDAEYRQRYLRVAAHELAHQWTGNLVTPAWWDELWLSESFATFLGDKVAADLGGFDDAPLRTQLDREDALAADAEARPRALRRAIADGDDLDETFDAIAYEKGAAVLAMFERHLGEGALRSALRAYVTAHAGGSVTTGDLVAAVTQVSSPAMGQALASYVEHTGTPIVELALDCSGPAAKLVAHARAGVQIPICVRYPGPSGGGRACGLAADRTELALPGATGCPAWIVGNDDGRGYYQIGTAPGSAVELPTAPLASITPAERLAHGDDLAGAIARGELAMPAALAALTALASSADPYVQLAATRVASALDPLVTDAARPRWTAWLAARFAPRLGASALLAPGKPVEHVLRDALLALIPAEQLPPATIRRARAALERVLASRDPDLGALSLALSLAAPSGGPALFTRVLARATKATDPALAAALVEGLGGFGPALADRVVAVVVDRTAEPAAALAALATLFARAGTRAAAWQAVHPQLGALFKRLGPPELLTLLQALEGVCDAAIRDTLAAELAPHVTEILDGRVSVDRLLAGIDRCVARRAAAGDLTSGLPSLRR